MMAPKKSSVAAEKRKALRAHFLAYRSVWGVLYVTLLPLFLVHDLLIHVWRSGPPRAWDGTGHYGIAQIYTQSIFPDTFGWTHAYLGGMPFPNFYPPLFYWCVALLHRTQLFTFLTSFKLLVLLPLLFIPAAIWLLAWSVSNRNRSVAFCAALVSVLPLVSSRFGGQTQWASGLDYYSTISIGLYTQPLGFVLLLVWYAVYVKSHQRVWLFTLASILLTLAVLANFLNGITATLIVASTLLFDLLRYRQPLSNRVDERAARRALIAHALSPIISAGLALFWLLPMLSTYEYFVTRPSTLVIITPDMLGWFVLAVVGIVCWFWRPTPALAPYVMTCCALAAILIFTKSAAPRWLPLQANRFAPTLYFLLAIPVGYAISTIYEITRDWLLRRLTLLKPLLTRLEPYVIGTLLLLLLAYYYSISQRQNVKFFYEFQARLAFYPPSYGEATASSDLTATATPDDPESSDALSESRPADINISQLVEAVKQEHQRNNAIVAAAAGAVNAVLRFAHEHRDGRYLVEMPSRYRRDAAAFDGRALNSYLGAQGNQTLTIVFREASPNSIFMFSQVGALSLHPDNFGFSSVLSDDIDFAAQPPAKHLERVRLLGARYLVLNSPKIKDALAREPAVAERYDFGAWSVLKLRDEPAPLARALSFRPALLVSTFTLKGRHNNEHSFIRFAEEQFADGWFDVLLVRAPTTKLDKLGDLAELNQFGALILDTYDCDRCDLVYRQLKAYAQSRPLILLMSDSTLFNRMRYSIEDFPLAKIVEREPEDSPGAWLDNEGATRRYQSHPIRKEWAQIRDLLEQYKVPSEAATVSGEIKQNTIELNYSSAPTTPPDPGVPVLISTTYHPNWRTANSQPVYAANPMFMLIFVRQSTSLTFARRWLDRLGLWASASTLVLLLGFTAWHYRRRLLGREKTKPSGGDGERQNE